MQKPPYAVSDLESMLLRILYTTCREATAHQTLLNYNFHHFLALPAGVYGSWQFSNIWRLPQLAQPTLSYRDRRSDHGIRSRQKILKFALKNTIVATRKLLVCPEK